MTSTSDPVRYPARQKLDMTRHRACYIVGMSHLTIAKVWIEAVLDGLQLQGLDRTQIAPAPADPAGTDRLAKSRLELVLARGIWTKASMLSDDPTLGLKVGSNLPMQASNVLAVLGAHAPSRRTAVDHIIRYQPLLSDSGRFRLTYIPGGLRMLYDPAWPDLPIASLQIDSVVAAVARGRIKPQHVRLVGRVGQDPRPFADILQCPVELGASQASLDYSDHDLDTAEPGADPALHDLALAYAESLLAARNRWDEMRQGVRSAIALFGLTNISMTKVAAQLGCSPRTLQRRLEASDTSFRDVVYSYRMEEAGLMLCRTDAPIETISELLGYSEPSAFSRAVQSWWGVTPRQLRAQQR